jgi:hypothetical protein
MMILARVIAARSYHFVIAVWRAKEAESRRREVLANRSGNLTVAGHVTRSG